jgi:hypothetical protein
VIDPPRQCRNKRLLGLSGEVAPDDLRAVLAGVSPHGEILTTGGVTQAKRLTCFDLTFSGPEIGLPSLRPLRQ